MAQSFNNVDSGCGKPDRMASSPAHSMAFWSMPPKCFRIISHLILALTAQIVARGFAFKLFGTRTDGFEDFCF